MPRDATQPVAMLSSVILSVRYDLTRVDPDFNTPCTALYDDFLKNVIFNSVQGRTELNGPTDDSF